MQVPDNIYELNEDIDIYTDEDGLEDEFIKKVGTADFRTYKYNDYIVAQWNYAAYGENNDYFQNGIYKGYIVDIIEKEDNYGYPSHFAHIASTLDGEGYVTVFALNYEDLSVGDEVYVAGCPVYDFDETHVVTGVRIDSHGRHPEISSYADVSEEKIQSIQVLLDEIGQQMDQPVFKINGKLRYIDDEFRLYTGYLNSTNYYGLLLSGLQDKNDMLSHLNETVCVEGLYMFDDREDNYIFSARIVEE